MYFSITVRGSALARLALSFCFLGTIASGQSTSITTPAAVRTNEVNGAIAARDLGDSRLTDHFFAFTGTPGDLLITVDARNLNGDVDVFTLTGMRPLLKFTVYEGSTSLTTKSIYLRKREDLILRIEARTPNDDEGTYRIRFGGAFEPIAGGPDGAAEIAETETPTVDAAATGAKASKKGRRVSSVGARIDEPVTKVAAAPTPEPEPAVKPARETPAPRTSTRNTRGRRPARDRTRTATEATVAKQPETVDETTTEAAPATPKPAAESRSTAGRRRPGRRGTTTTATTATKPAPVPVEESGPRLIIETSDGTLINRYMTSVRRVTVENGQVVVVGRDGKVERFKLADVVKMSVGP